MKIVPSLAFRTGIAGLAVFATAAVLGPLAAGAEEPRELPPIVAQAIELHGGDLYESTESAFDIASRSGTFRVEVRRDGGLYRQVVEADTPEGRRRVTATNDGVELSIDGRERRVPEGEVQRWRDHVAARVWFPYLPYGLAGDGVYAHDLGLEVWPSPDGPAGRAGGSRELHKVKVTFQPGTSTDADDEYLFWFDPQTGRLEQLAYSFAGGLRFRTAKNFRRVGGILFSDHENHGIDFEEGESRSVDEITPRMVKEEMEHISTVELRGIEVREIGESARDAQP